MQQFAPNTIHHLHEASANDRNLMAGPKHEHIADVMASEACINRCNVDMLSAAAMSDREQTCLRQCHVKYFDA